MMQISERRDSLSLSVTRTLLRERDTGSTRVFSRGSPHILSNEQGERGKFTIFYPFLLKERRLHEAERAQPRCAFWFLRWVETGGDRRVTILSNALLRIGEEFQIVSYFRADRIPITVKQTLKWTEMKDTLIFPIHQTSQ